MCTLAILVRPKAHWPVLIAANRDERIDRPFDNPGRHWPAFPKVTAGRDLLAGGTWLGCHDHGFIVGMLNRKGSLGPAAGKRSRGLLAIELLAHGSVKAALVYAKKLEFHQYRAFNLLLCDREMAVWLRWDENRPFAMALPEGVSLLTEGELNDPLIPRTLAYRDKFLSAAVPDPAADNYAAWQSLLLDTAPLLGNPRDYLFLEPKDGYGTLTSSILALGIDGLRWLYRKEGDWQKLALTSDEIRAG